MIYGYASDLGIKKNFVYFIRDGLGHIKIGISNNVSHRIAQLQTSNPNKLECFFVMSLPTLEDAKHIEKEMHKRFSKDRLIGEWFHEENILMFLKQDKIQTERFVFDGADWD